RDQEDRTSFKLGSVWVALARSPEDLAVLDGGRRWLALEPRPGVGIWTDDFSNIVGALRWWQPSRDTNGSP
ncbi:MAG: hypothetical protein ACE5KY_04455, partial [Candidatus Tectimicrobiota bacterium]